MSALVLVSYDPVHTTLTTLIIPLQTLAVKSNSIIINNFDADADADVDADADPDADANAYNPVHTTLPIISLQALALNRHQRQRQQSNHRQL